jgi:hypothetical protein
VVLVEMRIFGGDDSVLKIRGYLAEWNELIALTIWRVVSPSLKAALHVNRGCPRVDPSRSHKHQRGEQPQMKENEESTNDESKDTGSKEARAIRGLSGCIGDLCHVPES